MLDTGSRPMSPAASPRPPPRVALGLHSYDPRKAEQLQPLTDRMACAHDSYRTIDSHYDLGRGVLVYYWRCEGCGARLGEATRLDYRPSFDPRGNEKFRLQTAG